LLVWRSELSVAAVHCTLLPSPLLELSLLHVFFDGSVLLLLVLLSAHDHLASTLVVGHELRLEAALLELLLLLLLLCSLELVLNHEGSVVKPSVAALLHHVGSPAR